MIDYNELEKEINKQTFISTNELEKRNNPICMDYLHFIFHSVKQITDKNQQLKGYDFSGTRGKQKYNIDAKVVNLNKDTTRKAFYNRGIQFSFETIQKTKEDENGVGWGLDPKHDPDLLLWILDGPNITDIYKRKTKDYFAVLMNAANFKKLAASQKHTQTIYKRDGSFSGECKYITLEDIYRWENDYNDVIIIDAVSKNQIQKRLKGLNK